MWNNYYRSACIDIFEICQTSRDKFELFPEENSSWSKYYLYLKKNIKYYLEMNDNFAQNHIKVLIRQIKLYYNKKYYKEIEWKKLCCSDIINEIKMNKIKKSK